MDTLTKLDRAEGPPIHEVGHLHTPSWKSTVLENGTQLIEVNMGTQSLVSLEIIHNASRCQEDKFGVSRATARLIREGTKHLRSKNISETIDYYGASMATGANLDISFIKLLTLTKYFEKLLPIVEQVRYQPTFPQEELDRYIENNIQKLAMDSSKAELRSYKAITESIFGVDHPYGYNSTEEMYRSLAIDDLNDHYNNFYGSDNCIIVLSGQVTKEIREATIETFGKNSQHQVNLKSYPQLSSPQEYRKIIQTVDDKTQTALKIGTKLWPRNHKDFPGVFVLNTVLGGFFGSRLMSKIREEKGYTYSIYSGLDMLKHDGYFFISTEVAKEHIEDTISTIYSEIEILKNDLVPDSELHMIKNYLRGNFLNMVDGPFKVAGLVKLLEINDLSHDFFSNLSDYVKNIEAEEIQRLAKKYLVKDKMSEILIG